MPHWTYALELDTNRQITAGSTQALAEAIGRGADLRIYTEFHHNEHIDTSSTNTDLVQEMAEFHVTYLVDHRWCAGVMSQRQPVSLPSGFGPRSSLSFFLYNQNGQQAIARPHLDGQQSAGDPGQAPIDDHPQMPKYHAHDAWDQDTNAPSQNFIYDFERYRCAVSDSWREVLSHDATGAVRAGSIDQLATAFADGCAVKVAIADLGAELAEDPLTHEVFIETGSNYYYTEQKLFIAGSHPLVRIKPAIPMRYDSQAWDFGWLLLRTDGTVVYRRCDPYSLAFDDRPLRCDLRWFVR
ncbi:MAG: hypothetical protein GKR89_17560 [Candidatus Latescibacteria bacterium]|nr:hypothetical protein [Candidatus Latescibacterota bacterium]